MRQRGRRGGVCFQANARCQCSTGGTAAPSYKGAKLQNGMSVQVPPFVNAGTKIVVSTEDGSYVKRAE